MSTDECLLCLLELNCPGHSGTSSADSPKSPKLHFLRKGQVILHQDLPSSNIGYILEGVIKIYSHTESGKQSIHALLSPGELVGLHVLSESTISPYTAEIIEDARIYFMERSEAFKLIFENPKFTRKVLSLLIRAEISACQRNDLLVHTNVRERIAKYLLDLGKTFGDQTNSALRIRLKMSREEHAAVIGVTPETVIRLLSDFKKRNYISEHNHQIIINNREALESLCNYDSR